MSVRPSDLAERWGLSRGRISQLIAEGMPIDTVESAEAWRSSRSKHFTWEAKKQVQGAGQEATETGVEGKEDGKKVELPAIEEAIDRQRIICRIARNQYLQAVQRGSNDQARLYRHYDTTVSTLMRLEKEGQARAIANREYIKSQTAVERFSRVLAQIRFELEQGELEIAPAANPDNPARALKAYRVWRQRLMSKISGMAEDAIQIVSGQSVSLDGLEADLLRETEQALENGVPEEPQEGVKETF